VHFSIRQATLKDYEQLCELFEEIDAFHRQALPDVFREADEPARTKEYIYYRKRKCKSVQRLMEFLWLKQVLH